MKTPFSLAHIGIAAALAIATPVFAQVGGTSTSIGMTAADSAQLAFGWSAKKSILGKTVYDDYGVRIGKVEDVVVSPGTSMSYLIVGADGSVGTARHDVAIAMGQVVEKNGRLVLPGGSNDAVKALPAFEYATDTARRDQLVATSERDIAKAKATLGELQEKAGAAATGTRAKLEAHVTALDADVKSAESKLSDMKRAGASQWRKFEGEVRSAMTRMHRTIDSAKG